MAAGLPAGALAPVFLEQKQEHFMKRLALLAAILATFNVYADDPETSISAIKKSSMAGSGNDVAGFASSMVMAWRLSGGGIGGSGHTL